MEENEIAINVGEEKDTVAIGTKLGSYFPQFLRILHFLQIGQSEFKSIFLKQIKITKNFDLILLWKSLEKFDNGTFIIFRVINQFSN